MAASGPAPRRVRRRDYAALDLLARPVWLFDPVRGHIVWANAAAMRFWGASDRVALLARNPGVAAAAEEHRRIAEELGRRPDGGIGEPLVGRRRFDPPGGPAHADCVCSAVVLDDGRAALLVEATPLGPPPSTALSPGELRRIEDDLRERSRQLHEAQEVARLGDWRFEPSTGRFTWSPQLYRIWGVDPATFAPTLDKVFALIHPGDRRAVRDALRRAAAGAAEARVEFRLVQPASGGERHVWVQSRGERDAAGRITALFGICQDITERKRAEDRIRHLAHHDALTGLPNRALFLDRLHQALARAARDGELVAILQLDLDRFKEVNDALGHAAGDHLLREVARRLRACVRAPDTVARLGGDEFAVILPGLKRPTSAGRVAQQIVRAVAEPVPYDGQEIHPATSVGITLFPNDDTEPGQLMRNADIALYRAKSEGRGTFCFFVGDMKAQLERRKRLESDLRRALAEGQFDLAYQPEVDLAVGTVTGFEALLRWRHPERGLIAPNDFVPVAEETGLIAPIGELVLRRAVLQTRAWLDAGLRPGRVAVNLAAAQFKRGDLAGVIRGLLAEAGLPAAHFGVEVTEGAFLGRDPEPVARALERLDRLGVRIALDDFGIGYASLTHLKRFPVHRLKIDQSFVRDITADPEDAAIVRALIGLGHSLGMTVVAEGVETREQLDFLRRHACDHALGRLFAAPLTAAEVPGFLAGGPARFAAPEWHLPRLRPAADGRRYRRPAPRLAHAR